MKILFITPSFSKGGAEKNMLNIINSLDRKQFDIHLIICTSQSNYLDLLNREIKVYNLKKENVRSSLVNILAILRELKPHIVFTSALHVSLPILLLKKIFFLHFKKIVRIPSLPSNNLGVDQTKEKILSFFRTRLLKGADAVIAQTDQMRREISEYYKIDRDKIFVINNIVDSINIRNMARENIDLDRNYYYYIAAGSLYSVKGFDYLIDAFFYHIKEFPLSRLIIIGDESVEKGYKGYLEERIAKNNLEGIVTLAGYQKNPYKYFASGRAFVLPSLKEGFPNVVLENLVLNKPVLVTNCIDFTQIVTSDRGVIVEKASVDELVAGLRLVRNLTPKDTEFENFDFNKWFNSF